MKLGFYGFGHLARAITSGLLHKDLCPVTDIFVLAKSEKTKEGARALGFSVCEDAAALFACSDLILLAVKPAVFRDLAPSLLKIDTTGKRVVSLMASVGLDELKTVFGCPLLRVMPTVAIETGKDIIGITDPEGFEDVKALFEGLGQVHVLSEPALDRLTVVASCGPGFAARVLDSYALACEDLGFSKEQSVAITSAVFSFAAARTGEDPFRTLEEQVATRGGVTEAGNLQIADRVKKAFDDAFCTALEKTAPKRD